MSDGRIPCTKCGASILDITARLNAGLCGKCENNRLQEQAELQRKEQDRLIREKGFSYDIDRLLEAENFLLSVVGELPGQDSPCYPDLTSEEKVISDLASYNVLCGNGFGTLFSNGYFRLLDGALLAAREIGSGLLFEGLTEFWAILADYGFPRDPIQCQEMSTEDVDVDALYETLAELDEKYFHYRPGEPSLWASPDYPAKAKAYVREHIEIFRSRKNN